MSNHEHFEEIFHQKAPKYGRSLIVLNSKKKGVAMQPLSRPLLLTHPCSNRHFLVRHPCQAAFLAALCDSSMNHMFKK